MYRPPFLATAINLPLLALNVAIVVNDPSKWANAFAAGFVTAVIIALWAAWFALCDT